MREQGDSWRSDFEQALGESFGDLVCPPVPIEDASAHECCEVVWAVCGRNVTPDQLAALTDDTVLNMAQEFGKFFECAPPSVQQIRDAFARTLARWPAGSPDETV
jgi:hypothetical protein